MNRSTRRVPPAPRRTRVDPARTALVVCDMWDTHHCVSAARRVAEMAPRLNEVASALRRRGALIVHAPAGCIDFYAGTAQRARATSARRIEPPAPIGWNDWEPAERDALPDTLTDPSPCSCDTPDPCCAGGPPWPWRRQIDVIEIGAADAVTDDGHELFNLLVARGIHEVVVTGVHANVCVLGRPYGVRQLVKLGKRPLLCRDLTDAFHRDPGGHHEGTRRVVAHVERFWCPTVTSDELVGGEPFRFAGAGALSGAPRPR